MGGDLLGAEPDVRVMDDLDERHTLLGGDPGTKEGEMRVDQADSLVDQEPAIVPIAMGLG